MKAYTVHASPADPRPERFAFVKDGFSWPALFFPILWILWHRMWVTLLGYVAFALVVAVIDRFVGNGHATILAVTGSILLGLEGNTIRRLSLETRGWREIGNSFGANLAEAEIRFFHSRAELSSRTRDAFSGNASYSGGPQGDEPILGLFPEPER
jgi:hypothetical protein